MVNCDERHLRNLEILSGGFCPSKNREILSGDFVRKGYVLGDSVQRVCPFTGVNGQTPSRSTSKHFAYRLNPSVTSTPPIVPPLICSLLFVTFVILISTESNEAICLEIN